jgi:hypothetical protein
MERRPESAYPRSVSYVTIVPINLTENARPLSVNPDRNQLAERWPHGNDPVLGAEWGIRDAAERA